jgi:predicted Zn-dependent protease
MNIKEKVSIFFKKPYLDKYEELEILIENTKNVLARFADNDIIQSVSQEKTNVRFRLLKDKKNGAASTNDLTTKGLEDCFNKALSVLELMPQNNEQLPLYEDNNKVIDESLYVPMNHVHNANEIKKALDYVKENNMKSAGVNTEVNQKIIMLNSKGLEKESSVSAANFSISITKPNKGWAQSIVKNSKLLNPLEIAKKAVRIALMNSNPVSIDAKAYDVVLSPDAANDLFSFLSWYGFNAKAFYEKTGPFDELNKKVLGDNITITDEPLNEIKNGHLFDYEGVDKKNIKLVENGELVGVTLDRLFAHKLNMETTAHGLPQPNSQGTFPLNLVVKEGSSSKEEMIKSTKYGLYVNRFHYSNIINPKNMTFTGMTRDGLFLIEDGKITKAVKNLRFTDSITRLLNNVESLSKERYIANDFMSPEFSVIVPYMKINGFKFTSTTEF